MSTGERLVAGANDAHVHLMPERLMVAIRAALNDVSGWEFDYSTHRKAIESTLRDHRIDQYVALPYAHKPGVAADLNGWVLEAASNSSMCIPFATVHPQDDPRLDPAYELCVEIDRPVLHHAGNAPTFEDRPHVGTDRFRQFRERFPEVRACCAHVGTSEYEEFLDLARTDENVFLDTSFAISTVVGRHVDFDPSSIDDTVFEDLAGRIMYGSDFPIMPHTYEREYE